jgi:diamine N-acetyltransferase
MAFSFRLAQETDVDSLREFSERLFMTTYAAQNTPEDMALYCRDAFSAKNFAEDFSREHVRYLLATEPKEGHIAAYAKLILGKAWSSEETDSGVELARFYLDTPYQGLGLAASFMDYCLNWVREEGYPEVWLGVWPQNSRAVRFYHKKGFQKIGSAAFLLGTDLQTDDIMQKIL